MTEQITTQKIKNKWYLIKSDNNKIIIESSIPLVSAQFLEVDRYNNIYIAVETLLDDSPIMVKKEIRKYSPSGKLLYSVNIDLNYCSYPNKDIHIDQYGNIYQMRPIADGVQVIMWENQASLARREK